MSAGTHNSGGAQRDSFHARRDRCGDYGALETVGVQDREEQLCLPCAFSTTNSSQTESRSISTAYQSRMKTTSTPMSAVPTKA